MAHKIIITDILTDAESGGVEIIYTLDDGPPNSATFATMALMVGQSTDPIDEPKKGLTLALAWWLARDANAETPALILNKDVTIDFAAAVQITVSA
jgi:hypothetical protein